MTTPRIESAAFDSDQIPPVISLAFQTVMHLTTVCRATAISDTRGHVHIISGVPLGDALTNARTSAAMVLSEYFLGYIRAPEPTDDETLMGED